MKKINLLLFVWILAISASFAQAPTATKTLKAATLENASYAVGVALANNFIKDSMNMQFNRFYKGIEDVFNGAKVEMNDNQMMQAIQGFQADKAKADMTKVSYAIGLSVAKNFTRGGLDNIDMKLFKKGCNDIKTGQKLDIPLTETNQIISTYQKKVMAQKTEAAKAEGVKFLAENAKKKGVKTTPSGLQYKVIKPGQGIKPVAADKVTVHYTGTLIDGTKFDSSVDRGKPSTFGLKQVIKGWTEGLQLMKEGSKYRFFIPYNLAYGERGSSSIPGFAALIFDVELIKVVKAVPATSKQ